MRDPRIEQVLSQVPNLTWEYKESIPVSKINRRKSHANQARISEPLNLDKVKEYKNSMVAGDQFPASVFFIDGDEYVTSDGNHRNEAVFELGNATQDAYLVLCDDPVTRTALTFEWNAINGWSSTEEDRDRQLIYLIQQGMTQEAAARTLHVPRKRAMDVMAEDAGHTRAVELGVKSPWAKVKSRASRIRLTKDLQLDSVFTAAVRHASKFELTTRDVRTLVENIPVNRPEEEQLAYISSETRRLTREAEALAGNRVTKHRGQSPQVLYRAHLEYLFKKTSTEFDKVLFNLNNEEAETLLSKVIAVRVLLEEAESKLHTVVRPKSRLLTEPSSPAPSTIPQSVFR